MIFEKIKKIICEQLDLNGNDITEDTSFQELGLDSLELFQVIIEIEDAFGVQIEDAESFKTVGEAVKFVQKNTGQI
jgi:acyl carrier protein